MPRDQQLRVMAIGNDQGLLSRPRSRRHRRWILLSGWPTCRSRRAACDVRRHHHRPADHSQLPGDAPDRLVRSIDDLDGRGSHAMRRLIRRGQRERGASAVLFGLLLIPLLGFGGIAVDVGALYAEKAATAERRRCSGARGRDRVRKGRERLRLLREPTPRVLAGANADRWCRRNRSRSPSTAPATS